MRRADQNIWPSRKTPQLLEDQHLQRLNFNGQSFYLARIAEPLHPLIPHDGDAAARASMTAAVVSPGCLAGANTDWKNGDSGSELPFRAP